MLTVPEGNLRFKGCECNGPKTCSEAADCPCRKAGRECDPEACLTCDAKLVLVFSEGSLSHAD